MEELGEREKLGDVFAPEGASLLRAHLEPKQAVRVTPQSSLPVAAYLCSAALFFTACVSSLVVGTPPLISSGGAGMAHLSYVRSETEHKELGVTELSPLPNEVGFFAAHTHAASGDDLSGAGVGGAGGANSAETSAMMAGALLQASMLDARGSLTEDPVASDWRDALAPLPAADGLQPDKAAVGEVLNAAYARHELSADRFEEDAADLVDASNQYAAALVAREVARKEVERLADVQEIHSQELAAQSANTDSVKAKSDVTDAIEEDVTRLEVKAEGAKAEGGKAVRLGAIRP